MRRVLLLALLACVIAVIWFIGFGQQTELPTGSSTDQTSVPSRPPQRLAGAAGSSSPTAESTQSNGIAELREQINPARLAELNATVRGRAVDHDGEPLAECVVSLTGRQYSQQRLDAYVAERGTVEWKDPEAITTSEDGQFALRFAPPPPYQFTLTIRRGGKVSMAVRWDELQLGSETDLGDVVLPVGTVLSGRVVDTDLAPQAGVEVQLRGGTWSYGQPYAGTPAQAVTLADGTFEFPEPAPAGDWELDLGKRQLVGSAELTVETGQLIQFRQLVVKRLSDVDAITGIVVDDHGLPVPSVDLRSFTGGQSASTESDGTFRIEREGGQSPEPIEITLGKPGYERLTTEERYPWGTSDLRLVLPRGLEVEVLVTDARTGEPVEEFGVRCYLDPNVYRYWNVRDSRLREVGRHEGGRVVLTGVRRGTNLVVVEPIGSEYLPSERITFEVTDLGAPQQRVALLKPVVMTLEVNGPGGSPVSGTKVELIKMPGDTQADLTNYGTIVQTGSTDVLGQLELSGPPERRLALRILGPGHQPIVMNDVYLDPGRSPFRVEVPTGARLEGKVRPISVLEDFEPNAVGVERLTRGKEEILNRVRTGIVLQAPGGGLRDRFPLTGNLPIEDDGSFNLEGIPPGDWNVCLRWNIPDSAASFRSRLFVLDTVANLREGEVRELDLDISQLAWAAVSGKVFLNGVPLAGASVHMTGSRLDPTGERSRTFADSVITSADGSFAIETVSGQYEMRFQLRAADDGGWSYLPGRGTVSLSPGERVERVVQLQARKVRLRILSSDGQRPVEGVELYITTSDESWSWSIKTGADGIVDIENAPMESFAVWTAPNGGTADPSSRFVVGNVRPGRLESPMTLVMPVRFGR